MSTSLASRGINVLPFHNTLATCSASGLESASIAVNALSRVLAYMLRYFIAVFHARSILPGVELDALRAAQDNIETPHTTWGRQKGREAAAV